MGENNTEMKRFECTRLQNNIYCIYVILLNKMHNARNRKHYKQRHTHVDTIGHTGTGRTKGPTNTHTMCDLLHRFCSG